MNAVLIFVFLLEGNLMIARVAIKEEEQHATGRGVNDLVDAWKSKGILWTVLVEVCVVDTHPPFVVVLFENEYWVCQPLGVVNFFDESSCE